MDIRKIFQIGMINTIRMNFHYFGWGGVIYPRIIASRNLKIHNLNGSLKTPKKLFCVRIGFAEVAIFDSKYERCIWNNSGSIFINGELNLGQGVRISNSGDLVFGDKVRITANSAIVCRYSIEIESEVLISWETLIMDTDFHKLYGIDDNREQSNPDKKILIGEHTWIGCRSTILKGSVIPKNSIIAAGSIINKEFIAQHTIIGSNKILKNNIEWDE